MNEETRYQPPKAEVADVGAGTDEELATRGARLGAAIIDGLLGMAVIVPLMLATGVFQSAMSGVGMEFMSQLGFAAVGVITSLVFNGYLLHTSGQTIGKRLVGTRIVSFEDNRILPLWKIYALRYLPISVVGQVPVVGPLLSVVDSLFVFRGDRRCVHDLIAGTKVIHARAPWNGQVDANTAD